MGESTVFLAKQSSNHEPTIPVSADTHIHPNHQLVPGAAHLDLSIPPDASEVAKKSGFPNVSLQDTTMNFTQTCGIQWHNEHVSSGYNGDVSILLWLWDIVLWVMIMGYCFMTIGMPSAWIGTIHWRERRRFRESCSMLLPNPNHHAESRHGVALIYPETCNVM